MKGSLVSQTLTLIALGVFVSSAPCGDQKRSLPCSELVRQPVTLRGAVSRTFDHMSPETDFGDELVLDPMEDVVLVTLRRSICTVDEAATQRPVVEPSVTVVELVPSEGQSPADLRSHVGHVRTIKGKLAENVWWHYKATMQIVVESIE